MIVVGVDPGLSGGISVIEDGKLVEVYDMPLNEVKYKNKTRKEVSGDKLHYIFETHAPNIVCVESVTARPCNGVTSLFRFGQSFGVVIGVASSFWRETKLEFVTPQKWKRRLDLIGTSKDAARLKAIEIFESKKDWFKLKNTSGKADATLIALYGYLTMMEE